MLNEEVQDLKQNLENFKLKEVEVKKELETRKYELIQLKQQAKGAD